MTLIFVISCGIGGFIGGLLVGEVCLFYRQARTRMINRSRKYTPKNTNQTVMAR